MSTQTPVWTCPGASRGGGGRQIAPAGGTLLAVLILLAVLPSAAAVSSGGTEAAALATLVEAAHDSRSEAMDGGGEAARIERRVELRIGADAGIASRFEAIGVFALPSWGMAMASRGLGAMPPPAV